MNAQHTRSIAAPVLLLAICAGTAAAGPDWIEDGDAGFNIMTAQDTTSVGAIQSVAGILQGETDTEDVYRIQIENGTDFDNQSLGFAFRGMDTQFNASMWLFDSYGFGVLGNDDDPLTGGPDARLTVPSSDGVTLSLAPGIYYLAITESGNVPLGLLGEFGRTGLGEGELAEIFSFASSTEVSGPDGAAGGSVLAGWSGGAGNLGGYGIEITPTPSSAVLLGFGAIAAGRRRR